MTKYLPYIAAALFFLAAGAVAEKIRNGMAAGRCVSEGDGECVGVLYEGKTRIGTIKIYPSSKVTVHESESR
jgi:hypothetical protein